MKIFDCITFFNEFTQLQLRISILSDIVDYFIVVEADKTHSGTKKISYLSEKIGFFEKNSKLIVRSICFPDGLTTWQREQYQRDYIALILEELRADSDDIVIVSDADEIPNPKAISLAAESLLKASYRSCVIFEQRLFYFRLNYELAWSPDSPWLGSFAVRARDAFRLSGIRNESRNIYGRKFYAANHIQHFIRIEEGGWHFSYLGDDDALVRKINAFAHHDESKFYETSGTTVASLIKYRRGLMIREIDHEAWCITPIETIGLPLKIIESLRDSTLVLRDPDDPQLVQRKVNLVRSRSPAARPLSRIIFSFKKRVWKLFHYLRPPISPNAITTT